MGTTQTDRTQTRRSLIERLRQRNLVAPLLGVLLMCVLIVAFMPKAMTGQATAVAVDMLEEKSPWRDALDRPPEVVSPIQSDQVEYTPIAVRFFDDLRAGRYTLWLDGHGGGQPLGTIPLTAILSPASVGFLFLPSWFAVGLKTALMLLAGYGGTYLLLRRLRVSSAIAIAGGIAYAFSGTNLVYINRVEGALLLPALLWGLHRLADRPTARNTAIPAVALAWMWFEGFPAIFVFSAYIGGAWYLWLLWRAARRPDDELAGGLRRWLLPRLVAGAAAVGWGIGIAMIQLLPFLVFITESGALELRHYDSGTHINSLNALSILDIHLFGDPVNGPWYLGTNPYEGVTTAGLVVGAAAFLAALAVLLGRIRGPREQRDAWPFFVVTSAVILVLSFFGTPLLGLAYKLPGLAENPMWRSRYVLNLGLVVMAALGGDALLRRRSEGERFPRWSTAAATAVAVVGLVWQIPEVVKLLDNVGHRRIALAIGVQLVLTAGVFVLWYFARDRSRLLGPAAAITALVLFTQLAWPMRDFTPQAPIDDFYPTEAAQRFIAESNGDQFRFAASEWNFYPNSSVLNGTIDLRGQTIRTKPFKNLVAAAEPPAFVRDPLKIILVRDEWNLDSPALDELSLRLFALGTNERPYGELRALDESIGAWRTVTDGEVIASVALPPLAGVSVPLRADNDACDHAHVVVTLRQGGVDVATTSRPAYDATGDWTDFGLMGQSLDPTSPSEVAVSVTGDPDCTMSVATAPSDPGRAALRTFAPDPDLPLVSTDQAWIYERPTALPLVRGYGSWRSFPDQTELLAELTTRPAAEADIGLVVGEITDAPTTPSQVEILSSSTDDGVVRAQVRTSGPALVTGGNDLTTGWAATVDGEAQPLVAVDGAILGVVVPDGLHEVRFTYAPRSFIASIPVTLLSILAVIAVAADVPGRLRRRRHRGRGPTPAPDQP